MPFLDAADGAKLFYKDWGSGPPVVLIHGWPLSADMWEYQAPGLASAGFRVVAYDRRGFGRSEQTWAGYEYNGFSDDLAAVIGTLGLSDAALVGFSMGGGEIARYMSRHGGAAVRKAVLVSAVTPCMAQTADNPEGVDRAIFAGMTDALKTDRPAFLAGFAKGFFGVGVLSSPVSAELIRWCGDLAMQASPKATIDCVTAFGGTDFRPDMAHFRVPTLVIHGDADQIVPIDASGRRTAAMIAGAHYDVYEGAPHAVPLTHADRLTRDLVAFLR